MPAPKREPRGVLLGIDHGAKVIGLAVCDASWIVARPLARLARTNRATDFAHIKALIIRHQACGVVVGIPETPADFKGQSQARTVRRWATRLAAAVPVPVYTWDERLSTFEAGRLRGEAGADQVERLDDRSAAVILQSFIDAHPPGTALPAPLKRIERD
jgi:putative Holliday junction resolvase